MDSLKAKHIRQDLQDHLDRKAFGLRVFAVGEKIL